MLASLIGTKHFPDLKDLHNCILFWETDNTQSYRIERDLHQLKYAGVLDLISGMIIGKLPDIKRTAGDGLTEPTPKEIVLEVLKNYQFPILAEVDFGHKTINTPMPIGLLSRIDSDNKKFEVLESAVI
jgi:muramoyltetrapeptide carboxypeptidase